MLCKAIKIYWRLLSFHELERLLVTSAVVAECEPCCCKKGDRAEKEAAKRRKCTVRAECWWKNRVVSIKGTGTKWHSSLSHPPKPVGFSTSGCQCKLDWQLQPWFLPWAKPTVSHVLQKGLWGSKNGLKVTQPLLATPNSQYRTISRVHLCLSSTSELGPCPKDSLRMPKMVQILWDTISANHNGKTKVQLICINFHKDSSRRSPLAIAPDIYLKREKSLRMHKSDLRCFKKEWRSYHDQWTIKPIQLNG